MVPVKPTFKEAFCFWFKLGFISFGGPAGQIAIMHEFLVDKKKWISESRFLHALNYCMMLPGPEAQQLATYTGWMLHGRKGGLTAGIFFVLPSVLILWVLSVAYVYYGKLPIMMALFDGLKPAVTAIVFTAVMKIGKKSMKGLPYYILAVISFILIFFIKVSFILIILGAIMVGIIRNYAENKKSLPYRSVEEKAVDGDKEFDFVINKHTVSESSSWSVKQIIKLVLVFGFCWIFPYLLFFKSDANFDFWNRFILLFTSAAFVTFGGAYAVLPYIAQVCVDKLHWLSSSQMIDGLALGETTPGPLIMVLAFVGFMGAWNQLGGSLTLATLGLLVTTWYTFLPCFFFIFAGAPLIERTHQNEKLRQVLDFVPAAITGVILNLGLYFAQSVIFKSPWDFNSIQWPSCIWILISLLFLYRFKINIMIWIGVSALAGLFFNFASGMF